MSPRKMKSLDVPIELRRADAPARPARRVFVERHEIPGLVVGTARGGAVACRRVLGARGSGRIGLTLALAGLALAAPSLRMALLAAVAHLSLGLLVGIGARRRSFHRAREVQRLAVWTVLTPLGVAVLARPLGFGSPWLCVAAAIVGQLLLVRALRATRAV
jgi:hypothetical protein